MKSSGFSDAFRGKRSYLIHHLNPLNRKEIRKRSFRCLKKSKIRYDSQNIYIEYNEELPPPLPNKNILSRMQNSTSPLALS